MRVLVCGGRNFEDRALLFGVLNHLHNHSRITVLIHGAARGADSWAHEWATSRGILASPYPAAWKRDGRAAGPIRNQRMIDEGKPHQAIAFPGGAGTADMVRRAKAAGVPVLQPSRLDRYWDTVARVYA